MEKEFKIQIPETKLNIYAKQYGELDKPVAIFVHGLTGFMDEHLFYNGARYFRQHGISSLRFNLYDWPTDARKLTDCTLKTHAQDLNTVIDYLQAAGAKKIFTIGHSYGGPTILLANQSKLAAMVLWDPTSEDIFAGMDEAIYVKELNAYRIRWGTDVLIGSSMREEAKELDWQNLTTTLTTPLKVIAAEHGDLLAGAETYVKKAQGPKEFAVMKGATHGFSEEGIAEELFDSSIDWLKKWVI